MIRKTNTNSVTSRYRFRLSAVSWLGVFLCLTFVVLASRTTSAVQDNGSTAGARLAEPGLMPPRPMLPDHPVQPWLVVLSAQPDEKGGWAKGRFDTSKNRLVIDTVGVGSFTVDTSRLPIDWDRLVIIRLDGRNRELGRKENPVIKFVRSKSKLWETVGS